VLFPHGVLFRDSEREMRRKMISDDIVEAVIGLGKNLFYNSGMESCLLVCRKTKPYERKNKIIFVDAKNEIKLERSSAYLTEDHIYKIADAYRTFETIEGFAAVIRKESVLADNDGNLSLRLYVKSIYKEDEIPVEDLLKDISERQESFNASMNDLLARLKNAGLGS
jgi:type I restriction enzyme M protein